MGRLSTKLWATAGEDMTALIGHGGHHFFVVLEPMGALFSSFMNLLCHLRVDFFSFEL
jgi:hypothetical protein